MSLKHSARFGHTQGNLSMGAAGNLSCLTYFLKERLQPPPLYSAFQAKQERAFLVKKYIGQCCFAHFEDLRVSAVPGCFFFLLS